MSINIELNTKEINIEICKNTLNMLYMRKLIDNTKLMFDSIHDQINNKVSIDFLLNNNIKCSIYILNIKLTSIIQGTPLDIFLSNNNDVKKIIVIKDFAKKVAKQIFFEYKNAEIFFEHELLEDISKKIIIPEHQLLIKEEKEELFNKFKKSELSKIHTTDMMARYYNAKIDDVFRIIRPSLTSGKSIVYRIVIEGPLDNISNCNP